MVDVEKAFDSISWEYISIMLNIFNFNKNTLSLVKSLQKNSSSKILQNGHLSNIIHLERGCRQGDPISPHLFVLAVELLGETFRKYSDIQGREIGRNEHRISQFADDTPLFMNFREENLRRCMDLLTDLRPKNKCR